MIHSHVYARHKDTRVFANPVAQHSPMHTLERGDWLGVLEIRGGWLQVIAAGCEGWVHAHDVEVKPPFQLHITLEEEHRLIRYVNRP